MKKEKKKFKAIIMSYVLAFVCITSWVALGVVLALTSANISVNGKISFTANDVYADVTGTVTGTATTNTLEAIHLTADTTSFTTPSSWSDIAFDFVNGQTDIVFTINVTNKSTENSILVTFDDNISATNTTITRKSAGAAVSSLSALVVPKSTTKTVEITLSVEDKNLSASGNFDLGINLTSLPPAKDQSEYPTLSFTYDDSAKTATVKQNSSNAPSGNLVIPNSVIINGQEYPVLLGSNAFEGCSELTSVTIPEGITNIAKEAFAGCQALTSITIPASVTSIGNSAFIACSALTSITIPARVDYIEHSTFYGCSSLTSITIPSGVNSIGDMAFEGCPLTSITIPESVTSIGDYAFADCSKLKSVTFENTTGWKAGDTTLSSSDLANKTTAATYLTSTYLNVDWTRS